MFIPDLFKRLGSQSPKFFRTMQIVASVVGILAFCVSYLIGHDFWQMTFEAENRWVALLDGTYKFCGGALFAAATSTTKAELMDDKTKVNVLKDAGQ